MVSLNERVKWPQDAQAKARIVDIDLDQVPPKPVITMENVYEPETDYERWLMKLTRADPPRALQLRTELVAEMPVFDGPEGNVDVLPPGAPVVVPPQHWLKTPIHFTPLWDPRYPRLYYTSKNYYTFTRQDAIRELYGRLLGGTKPRRLLDIGTGVGPGALALGQLFPQAESVGIDLGAHFIRFARGLAEKQGVSNARFYQQHGAATAFPDDSFDVVTLSYVLHEMPKVEAQKIIAEMKRLVRPGGRAIWVDVIYDDTEEDRQARVQRGKAPEPFLAEYMRLNIEEAVRAAGFINISKLRDPEWDCMVVTAIKL